MSSIYKKINYTYEGPWASTEVGTLYMRQNNSCDHVDIVDQDGYEILSFGEWGDKDKGQAIIKLLTKSNEELENITPEERLKYFPDFKERNTSGWDRPEWSYKNTGDFGNTYFFALEAVCSKIVGYDPTVEEKDTTEDFFKIEQAKLLSNSIISQGEGYTHYFFSRFKDLHKYENLSIFGIFGKNLGRRGK